MSPDQASSFSIRLLTRANSAQYRKLRLQSLKDEPVAFLSTHESEEKFPEEIFANHLDASYHPPYFGYFGMFDQENLIGYVQVAKTFLDKQDHVALVNNLYLSPEYRGQGLGTKLLSYVSELLKSGGKVERLFLTCSAKNTPAMKLYERAGFTTWAIRPQAIKWQGKYDDQIEMVKVL